MTTVCFIIFNRPALARKVFERIATARPTRLLVAADGPRPGREADQALCEEARSIIADVNWPCDVQWDFSDVNLGLRKRIVSGINLALESDDRVIVLEDDCVPEPSFFQYCDMLLDRYANDHRIMGINGDCFHAAQQVTRFSYHFSQYQHCWGWATWRRAWEQLDLQLMQWPDLRDTGWLFDIVHNKSGVMYWREIFDTVRSGAEQSWAYAWLYSCWIAGGLAVTPSANLVTNVGWGPDATHTKTHDPRVSGLMTQPMRFPLVHPNMIEADDEADEFELHNVFGVLDVDIKSRLKRVTRRSLDRIKSRPSG